MNKTRALAVGLVVLLAFTLIGVAAAEGLADAISRYVFSGGGGAASAGDVSMNASLGQPVVGLSSAGDTKLSAGYWGSQAAEGPSYQIMLPLVVR